MREGLQGKEKGSKFMTAGETVRVVMILKVAYIRWHTLSFKLTIWA